MKLTRRESIRCTILHILFLWFGRGFLELLDDDALELLVGKLCPPQPLFGVDRSGAPSRLEGVRMTPQMMRDAMDAMHEIHGSVMAQPSHLIVSPQQAERLAGLAAWLP